MSHPQHSNSGNDDAPELSTRLPPARTSERGSGSGLTPIQSRPLDHLQSHIRPSPQLRTQLSPTASTSTPHYNIAAVAANQHIRSRQSSVSSTNSLNWGDHATAPATASTSNSNPFLASTRSRTLASSGSPRLAASLTSLSSGGGSTGGGPTRFPRHSPAISLSTSVASPVSSPRSASASSSQISSLLVTQLNILLSTLKDDSDRGKWTAQADKVRKLVDDSGMDSSIYLRRLLQGSASQIFPNARAAPAGQDNAGSYQLFSEEMMKIAKEPQQAEKIAQALDTNEGELFRDFDLPQLISHFKLDALSQIALALACRTALKADLRAKADKHIATTWPLFLQYVSQPQSADPDSDYSPLVLATIVERTVLEPPEKLEDEKRDNLFLAIKLRYINHLRTRIPVAVESAMFLDELFASQDSRLAKVVQRAGPRSTSSIEMCRDMLAGVETRDISYNQVASALLFMVIVQGGDLYDAGIFVDALRLHRAGAKIDWTDVVQGFDRENLRVTKKQFLALYNALLPLAKEYSNLDIQLMWGGQWQYEETQLSFVVAFLATTPEELDVGQIPNLRQCFELTEFATASQSVKDFAEQALRHPLVSRDATQALFSMIFRSQESYSVAQMLGIPDTVINQNMPVFVCAASAIPKPWAPLQDQALKQLLFPFVLKRHENYDFVMHALWQHDKTWLAGKLVEFYAQELNLLRPIYEHAQEHSWLADLLTLHNHFAIDLAAYAHGMGHCDLEEWAQQLIAGMNPLEFVRALYSFLKMKMDDENNVQREHLQPTMTSLTIKTVHTLLLLISENVPDDTIGTLLKQCLQTWPRLFNYGEDDARNEIIETLCQQGHALPESATKEMEDRYKLMYSGTTTPDDVVTELNRLKTSEDPNEQDLFAAMLFGLFEEYSCFGEYPNEALAVTAVLFGGLIARNVLFGIAEQAAIFMMVEAASESTQEDPMYKFGLQALIHCIPRLKEWPLLAERIFHTPNLRSTQVWTAAEAVVKKMQHENLGMNGDGANGITNGVVDDDFSAEAAIPAFTAIQVDPPLRESFYEDPNEDISDKVTFVLNNVSKRNLEEKFKEIESALEDKYHSWFAHYLVEELAKSQPNFQSLYLSVLDKFNQKPLWAEVLRETYMSCQKMINAQSTMDNQHERATLKNLAVWLGSITLARNQPILHRNLSFKELLLEGYDTQRQLVAIPFTCKTLVQAAHSKVFRPPNPWIVEILSILAELYHATDLKLNLKFEIEMLFREFQLEMNEIPMSEAIRSRPLLDLAMMNYVPDGPDAFGDMALMGLSKRGPNERFSPDAVIQAVPDLGGMLQIPQAVGAITQQQMRSIFVNAAQQAIYEIIAPVVERSVTIASISTSELIQKDFNTEGDVDKMRNSAHTMVRALSGSLALVTCKEPLRMSITNNIRLLAARSLPEQLPEGQILMFVNDNIDTVCSLVERAAEEHSLAEINLQLQQAFEDRRQHNEQRPNEPFSQQSVSRWATLIPDPYRQDQNGLNRQQLALYEEFGRVARLTPAVHANSISQDSSRQLPDVLPENYLPSLQTPAEAPAMPRPTQQRTIGPAVNGYMDNPNIGQRIMELIEELQQTSREAPEEHISEIGEGAPIRRVYGELVGLIERAPGLDALAVNSGMQCLNVVYNTAQKRLEVEVFVRLLTQLCRMSTAAGRNITMQLATADNDHMYNAAATVALHNEGLLELQHIDTQIAKGIKSKRHVALPFLKEIVDELLLGDNPMSFRTDFVLTYEALSNWLHEEPGLDLGREIMTKLQLPANQVNGMPSPESDSNKIDQHEYIFEEWVRLQRKDLPDRTHLAFMQQIHNRGVIAHEEEAIKFFRACLDMSCAEYDRISAVPYATLDQAYVHIDALAKLIAMMVIFQSTSDGEPQANKAKPFAALIRLVILIMNDHHRRYRERFNGRVYFRLFSTFLCEVHGYRQQLTIEQSQAIFGEFANALQVLQPRYFPGFMHGWLSLLGHRLFLGHFLDGQGRTNGGWDTYTRLVHILLVNLGDLLSMSDVPAVVLDYYRGVIRFFLMLHHDFPEFLIENHMQLDASIPVQCVQLLNIVNSATPRTVYNDQPDPFTPGLKINRLEQVRQAPAVHSTMSNVLDEAGIRTAIDRICEGGDISEQDFGTIVSAVDRSDGQTSAILVNALVLYVGVHATSASSVFSSAAAPARLLERLLRESREQARYYLITAMANQVRYINAHTHYFSTALQHMFSIGSPELQEQIMRLLCERAVPRPHPWGIIVMLLEMMKNQTYDLWNLPFMKAAPQVEHMLVGLAHRQDHGWSGVM
ncbi:General negative regulator of transcription subunit 1 [Fulvia fulva]|uniref:General negative regulator of transcription subunit 1 n=1 Tax=Passalora fulva TaxID=5499 RepID=A0A9Q8PCY7_PASFU|nr:General negative regulator of transcription subunit 1 [Fulvia fulva]UJO20132.1 General negative regulator of transcription subunit 1 [Fulvia fulva]